MHKERIMRKKLIFSLVIVFTGIISAPVSLSPSVQTEVEIMSVYPMEKTPLPRLFFRLEKEIWVRNYIPRKGSFTASGRPAKFGEMAVDKSIFPFGTVFLLPELFPGQKFVASDIGDFSGDKLDLCRDYYYPQKLAKKFGKKRTRVVIIKPLAG